jgi:hypothetical protein
LFSQDKSSVSPVFPDDWMGVWEGNLHIYRQQQIIQSVPMIIENLPTDTVDVYTWGLTYITDNLKSRKPYVLRTADKSQGHYIIDEKNGILLDGYVIGNKFVCNFEVMTNRLTSVYEITEDQLIFEIIVTGIKEKTISPLNDKNEPNNNNEVKTYPVISYQKAILTRKK